MLAVNAQSTRRVITIIWYEPQTFATDVAPERGCLHRPADADMDAVVWRAFKVQSTSHAAHAHRRSANESRQYAAAAMREHCARVQCVRTRITHGGEWM